MMVKREFYELNGRLERMHMTSQFFRTMVLMQQGERPKGVFKPSKLCNAGAVLYQLSCQAISEFIHIIDPHND